MALGDEQHRVTARACLTQVHDPVVDAPLELKGRLARDVTDPRIRCIARIRFDRQFLKSRRMHRPLSDLVPGDEGLVGWPRHHVPAARGLAVTHLELAANLACLRFDLLELRHEDLQATGGAKELERGG